MFLWSAIAHLVAVTSPGPDTALIIRQVARGGRASGYYSAAGIGFGVFIHSVLASSGISLLLISNENLKFIISLIGGLFLLYLGINSFVSIDEKNKNEAYSEDKSSFIKGLFTNIFNIKALIFFVSLFTIIADSLSGFYLLIFPLYFGIMTTLWFTFLTFVLTTPKLNTVFINHSKNIEKIAAIFLIGIGLLIIFTIIYEY